MKNYKIFERQAKLSKIRLLEPVIGIGKTCGIGDVVNGAEATSITE